jgi:hypothetical protein
MMRPMEGRQQELMSLDSGEQERTLRGHEYESKGLTPAAFAKVSTIVGCCCCCVIDREVMRTVERAIGKVMERNNLMAEKS